MHTYLGKILVLYFNLLVILFCLVIIISLSPLLPMLTWIITDFWAIPHTLETSYILFNIKCTMSYNMHLIPWICNLSYVRHMYPQVSSSMVWYQNPYILMSFIVGSYYISYMFDYISPLFVSVTWLVHFQFMLKIRSRVLVTQSYWLLLLEVSVLK